LKKEGVRHQCECQAAVRRERREIVADAGKKGAVTIATNMAGRGVDIKLGGPLGASQDYEEVKAMEDCSCSAPRHEARRIDNQLRGRSGRQGDPGETQFFVSLEDNLIAGFCSDTVKNMMVGFGIAEDQPIENRFDHSRLGKTPRPGNRRVNFDARSMFCNTTTFFSNPEKIGLG